MKVILLQDVAKIGRRFSIVEVPHGFALNKLIPQGLAKEATSENVKQIKAREDKIATEHANADKQFVEAVTSLEGKEITVYVDANENGHLFEALKPQSIVAALEAEGAHLGVEHVHVGTPIKSVGTHMISLVSGDQRTDITLTVSAR